MAMRLALGRRLKNDLLEQEASRMGAAAAGVSVATCSPCAIPHLRSPLCLLGFVLYFVLGHHRPTIL